MSLDINFTKEDLDKILELQNFQEYLKLFIQSVKNNNYKKYELELLLKYINKFKEKLNDLNIFENNLLETNSISSEDSKELDSQSDENDEGKIKLEVNSLFKNMIENNFHIDKINLYKKNLKPVEDLSTYLKSCKKY